MANIKKISELDAIDDTKINKFLATDTDGNTGLVDATKFAQAFTAYVDTQTNKLDEKLSQEIENKQATIEPIILKTSGSSRWDMAGSQPILLNDLYYNDVYYDYNTIYEAYVIGTPILVNNSGILYKVVSMQPVYSMTTNGSYNHNKIITYACNVIVSKVQIDNENSTYEYISKCAICIIDNDDYQNELDNHTYFVPFYYKG